jgi:hypothetical protein
VGNKFIKEGKGGRKKEIMQKWRAEICKQISNKKPEQNK